MESSVAADVKEPNPFNEPQTQQKNDTLQERKDETKSTLEPEVKDTPEDGAKVEKVKDIEVYQFGDSNRFEELNKAFDELNVALSEMKESLNIIDKPPEVCLLEVTKNLQKNFDRLKGEHIQSILQTEIFKSENASGVASSSSKAISRVEMDVIVKSPNTNGDVTENITAGVGVEPQKIEDKKEQSPMEDGKIKEAVLKVTAMKKGSEADSSRVDVQGANEDEAKGSAKATASEKEQVIVFHMYPPPEK